MSENKSDRGDIWLATAGLVFHEGKVLVVKKAYGATKGLWTLPSGFVKTNETIDQAAVREVREETGIETTPVGIVAVRSGTLRYGKHDTLLVFRLRYLGGTLQRCERELETVGWLPPTELSTAPDCTEFLATIIRQVAERDGLTEHPIRHTRDYGYSSYKIFF
jgi:8-oxo-dGTP diphosphatase